MVARDPDIGIIDVSGKMEIHLGRAAQGNDIVLPHPAVSEYHAQLAMDSSGTWSVVDLESDYGTYVNLQRVGPDGLAVELEKDTIWVAPYGLRLSAQEGARKPKPAHLRLDLVNLVREVRGKVLVDLRGTPLAFSPGEFIAIVGGSGAGKSTLLKALLGMDTIPARGCLGDVYFNNQLLIQDSNVRAFAPLNTIVGYVPQQDNSIHFRLSPYEVLDFAARLRFAADVSAEERHERIEAALASVRLESVDLRSRSIHKLSGGQRKRVNVALELVAAPRLLFLDEPTTGLDPGLDLEMMELLRDWAKGDGSRDPKTIVLITHATENVRLCDLIIFLGQILIEGAERGGCVLYFGPPGETAASFFRSNTFSEIYQEAAEPERAGNLHKKLTATPEWGELIWQRSRTATDVEESAAIEAAQRFRKGKQEPFSASRARRQFMILVRRYWLVLRRDRGAFAFQLLQGILVALLLWGVASEDTLTIAGVRSAPTTLFVMGIAATWLGILNASKEIVRERRIYGRERRYGLSSVAYVSSKVAVLSGLGLWQMVWLVSLTVWRFSPESHVGTLSRALPGDLRIPGSLEVEWLVTLELLLIAGVSLGLCISAFARSLDQATMMMFPAMLLQVLLAGLLFDVGPLAWLSFTHWGLQALGNSLDLEALYVAAGKASDPILEMIIFTGGGFALMGHWLALMIFSAGLIALTCWRQGWQDKARIPDD